MPEKADNPPAALPGRASRIHVVDSHTAGEPTRVVIAGGPELGNGSMAERLDRFRREHDRFRSAVVNEPRGSDALVGALLCAPCDPTCAAGVIFFNNVGYLGMCGHGTIGLMATLEWLGRLTPGKHRIETPVGEVTAELHGGGTVTVSNVPSYRFRQGVEVEAPGVGRVRGDIAWGGNWFFLVEGHGQKLDYRSLDALTEYAWQIRQGLEHAGIRGANGAEIDHIELVGAAHNGGPARNFVLCPGKAYDRSPCGTGTSAKLACLHADGKLQPGETWRQEGILGTSFEGRITLHDGKIEPHITGSAYVTGEAELVLDERDPFCWGIRA